jgi:uncharacterized protein YqgC (DUF456 family)
MTIALWVLAAICVTAGVAGIVLPVLPGAPLVWLGLLFAAWADGFMRVSGWTLAFLAVLALSTVLIDLLAAALGAKRVGASRWALVGAALGTVVGLFFSLPGLVLGPFAGAVIGELLHRRNDRPDGPDWKAAGKVGLGTTLGLVLGMAAKSAVIFTMLGVFALDYLIQR